MKIKMFKLLNNLLLIILIASFTLNSVPAQDAPPKPKLTNPDEEKALEDPKPDLLDLFTSSASIGITNESYVVNYTVKPNGTFVKEVSNVFYYDRLPQSEELKQKVIYFNSDIENVEVKELFKIKPDGKKVSILKTSVKIQPTPQAEAAPDYSSLKMLTMDFSDLKAKEKIQYTIRVEEIKPIFEGFFDTFELLSPFESWENAEINLIAPTDFSIAAETNLFKGGKSSEDADQTIWKWNLKDYKAKNVEFSMTGFLDFSPLISISNLPNYESFGKVYTREISDKVKITPEIKKLSNQITEGLTTNEEKAKAIYGWVNKNVRYVLVFLDRGGWIPREASTILKNGYGDCKDYTILIKTLLKAQNIESVPVLIRADTNKNFPAIPMIDYFNHMILYVPDLDTFADATVPNTKFGEMSELLYGKKAVLLGINFEIKKLPEETKLVRNFTNQSKIEFMTDGSVQTNTKITSDRNSMADLEDAFEHEDKMFFQFFAKTLYAFYGLDGTGKLIKYEKPEDSGFVNIEMENEISDFLQFEKSGEFQIPITNLFADYKSFEILSEMKERTTPLVMGMINFRDKINISFPKGMTVESVPQNLEYLNEFGEFKSTYKLENNVVKVERKFSVIKDYVEIEKYPEFNKLLQTFYRDLKGKIKYKLSDDFVISPNNLAGKDKKPVTIESILQNMIASSLNENEPILPGEVEAFEKKLKENPDDTKLRIRLIKHYDAIKRNTKGEKILREHLKWFIRNQPENRLNYLTYGRFYLENDDPEYLDLKNEWYDQLAKNPNSPALILNISEFVRYEEPEVAEGLLLMGSKKAPDNYEFPKLLFEIYKRESEQDEVKDQPEVKAELEKHAFEQGEKALSILKTNRDSQTDSERAEILLEVGKLALQIGNFERAKQIATNLILEYGQSTSNAEFDDATHTGNIILGKVALIGNQIEKAKEYLLISIKAPLRDKRNFLTPDLELANKLLDLGEKDTVLEYLKLCQELKNFKDHPDLYGDEMKALKKWQKQIENGKKPKLDFDNP